MQAQRWRRRGAVNVSGQKFGRGGQRRRRGKQSGQRRRSEDVQFGSTRRCVAREPVAGGVNAFVRSLSRRLVIRKIVVRKIVVAGRLGVMRMFALVRNRGARRSHPVVTASEDAVHKHMQASDGGDQAIHCGKITVASDVVDGEFSAHPPNMSTATCIL